MLVQSQRTILIVDDSPEDRETYRRYLSRDCDRTYTFLEAESAEQGLELCHSTQVDGILLDFLLPDLDGLEFLTELQAQANKIHPPVIMLTGQGNESIAVQAMKAGAQDYLIKGRISAEELCLAVDGVIEKAQLCAQLQQSEDRLKLALEGTQMGIWEWNIPTNTVVWSELVGTLFGLPSGTCIPTYEDVLNLVHPGDREYIQNSVARAIEEGTKHDVEFRTVWSDGSVHWLSGKGQVYYNRTGQPMRMVGSVVDITQTKLAEAERQQQIARELIITQIAQYIRQSLNLNRILSTTVTEVRQFLQTDRVLIFRLLSDGSGTVVSEAVSPGWTSILSTNIYDPCFTESYVESYSEGLVTTKTDIYNAGIDPCHVELLAQFQVRANLVVPILQGENLWGLLIAHHCSAPRQWQQEEINLLKQLATQVGIAIQQAELYQQAQNEIAERRQAEVALQESQERLRLALDAASMGTWDWNIQTNQITWSANLERMFGMQPGEFDGRYETFVNHLHPEDRDRVLDAIARAVNYGEEYDIEFRVVFSDGTIRWAASKGKVFYDTAGVPMRMAGVDLDITERKQAELERTQLLEREQAARVEAESANRVKDEFLAVLSHELRSPLNPILGWSQILQSHKLDETKTAEALAIIERNARLQVELIEDLLDVSRILRGKLSLNISSVNLESIISAAIETVRLAAQAKSIDLKFSISDFGLGDTGENLELSKSEEQPINLKSKIQNPKYQVMGDPSRLQQIVWNLLSNAVKFTPSGGRVEVRLSLVGTLAQIQVIDTGQGISADFLPYVFDYFRQADSATTRKFSGLGLGLAIVRQLVELHGGTIFAESPGEGQGATFTFRLPLMRTTETKGEKGTEGEVDSNSPNLEEVRILVVDDDADSRDFIAFILEQDGASVTAAESAVEALQILAQSKPNILLSDIGMPEMDGYMLMRQVRTLTPEQGGEIPAIALTAYAGEFDQQQAFAAGFQMHMSKPVDPVELIAVVAKLARC